MKKVIVITGPTGVGKTNLSISLAKYFHGEIINADASQIHQDLNIGTAKISNNEMNNITHYLIDCIKPTEEYSIKDYQDEARKIIDNLKSLPFIVGGSGLYIKSVIDEYNLSNSSRQDHPEWDNLSNDELYQLLYNIDKETALDKNNINDNLNENYKCNKHYNSLVICLTRPREELYNRINQRCEDMFQNGWIDECISLRNKYSLKSIKEIGYKEIDQYLDNKNHTNEDLINLKELIKQKTRNYAKRQMTWFRHQLDCKFINMDNDTYDKCINLINNFLIE